MRNKGLRSKVCGPIHISKGEMNETAGDGVMIIFEKVDAKTNSVSAVNCAIDIYDTNNELNQEFITDLGLTNVNMRIDQGMALWVRDNSKGILQPG